MHLSPTHARTKKITRGEKKKQVLNSMTRTHVLGVTRKSFILLRKAKKKKGVSGYFLNGFKGAPSSRKAKEQVFRKSYLNRYTRLNVTNHPHTIEGCHFCYFATVFGHGIRATIKLAHLSLSPRYFVKGVAPERLDN